MLVVDVEIKIAVMVLVAELVINNLTEQYISGRCNNLAELLVEIVDSELVVLAETNNGSEINSRGSVIQQNKFISSSINKQQ